MLKVKQIEKKFGKKRVLNGITFTALQHVTGIIGPNGAGKTTLLRMIAGITNCSGGEIAFENSHLKSDIKFSREEKQILGKIKRIVKNT